MDFDFEQHLGVVERSVSDLERDGQPARAVTLARSYDTTPADLWNAMTDPERLPRWFLPIRGDLRLGGRYQLQGNASGVITECEPPVRLALTWEFGGGLSWVEVDLAPDGPGRARLTLTHTALASDPPDGYGPGAVGVGWDLSLLGLAIHLDRPDAPKPDEAEFAASAEGRAFIVGSSEGWGRASIAAGTDAATARAAAGRTSAFYTGEVAEES